MARCVVLDIGGVLEVTPSTGWLARWVRDAGLDPGSMQDRLGDVFAAGAIGNLSEAEVIEATRTRLPVPAVMLERFWDEMWQEYLGSLNTELYEWFRELRPRWRTAILSNSFVGAREREQQHYGFADVTDLIVYSHEVGLAKPDPAVYELTCKLLQVTSGDIVFVDDTPEAIDGARAAGWTAVLFQDNQQVITEVEGLLTGVGESW